MIPILMCSILSLTILLERLIMLRKPRVIPPKLLSAIQNINAGNIQSVMDLCSKYKSPFASISKKLLINSHLSSEETAEIIKVVGRQDTSALDRGLFLLDLSANISPLLGLLGTVLGMIDIFDVISRGSMGQAELLSAGIAKALITTVAGLVVGIPSLAAYTFLIRKTDMLIDEIDKQITNLHYKIYGIKVE